MPVVDLNFFKYTKLLLILNTSFFLLCKNTSPDIYTLQIYLIVVLFLCYSAVDVP